MTSPGGCRWDEQFFAANQRAGVGARATFSLAKILIVLTILATLSTAPCSR